MKATSLGFYGEKGRFMNEEREKQAVAQPQEILEFFTQVLRGQYPGAKSADSFKAAELLGRRYGLFADKGGEDGAGQGPCLEDYLQTKKGGRRF